MSPNCRANATARCVARHKLLEVYRQKAIEAALRRVDMVGIAPEFETEAEYHTLQNGLSWRTDPMAATEIETRLGAYGFDQRALNTEVYVQAREIFVLFESLLNAAQTKRLLLLREIRNLRCMGATRPRLANAAQTPRADPEHR
jgi:hypothetical protein